MSTPGWKLSARALRPRPVWAWALAVCLVTLPARAAIDMFLQLAGVKGESTDKARQDEIDVLAWSWGLSGGGGRTATGSFSLRDLTLTKWVDKSTPLLMQAACTGKHFTNAVLALRRPLEAKDFYRLELTDVLVASLSTGGSGGEDRLTENVSFKFKTFKIDYIATDPSGKPEKPSGVFWDAAMVTGGAFVGAPLRATNFVATLSFSGGASTAALSWTSVPGKSYAVSFAGNLNEPFIPFATYPAGGSQVMTIAIPLQKATEFFRVEEVP